MWGTWGTWTSCSATCGGGTRTRTKLCDSPAPANGGMECSGDTGSDNTEDETDSTCNSSGCKEINLIISTSFIYFSSHRSCGWHVEYMGNMVL